MFQEVFLALKDPRDHLGPLDPADSPGLQEQEVEVVLEVASRRRRRSVPRLDSFMVRGGVAGGVALAGPPPGSTAPSSLCDTLLTSCSYFT